VIPKVFNGKDKLFFFADYMGMRRPTPPTVSRPSVTPLEFSPRRFLATAESPAGKPAERPFSSTILSRSTRPANASRSRNNQVPLSLQSPVARALYATLQCIRNP